MSAIESLRNAGIAALEAISEEAEREREGFLSTLESIRHERAEMMRMLESATPTCRNPACGESLPSRTSLDALERLGVDVRAQLEARGLLMLLSFACSQSCAEEIGRRTEAKREGLRMLHGGGR